MLVDPRRLEHHTFTVANRADQVEKEENERAEPEEDEKEKTLGDD
jgi:hypothetical protein